MHSKLYLGKNAKVLSSKCTKSIKNKSTQMQKDFPWEWYIRRIYYIMEILLLVNL